MRRAVIFLLPILATLALPASAQFVAQSVSFDQHRVQIVDLTGPWRFHAGDDPAWAASAFDDSHWSLIRADQGWSSQGYAGYAGIAWYRLDLELPAQHPPLALYIPGVDVSCQIFVNGRLIGENGSLSPRPLRLTTQRVFIPIPDDVGSSGHLELAIRVWNDPNYGTAVSGGLHPAPRIGDRQSIDEWRWLQERRLFWENASNSIQLGFNLLGMFTSLGLFMLRSKDREYLWFCLSLLSWSTYEIVSLHSAFYPDPFYPVQWLLAVFFTLGIVSIPVFLVSLFRLGWGRLIAASASAALVLFVVQALRIYLPGAPELQFAFAVVITVILIINALIALKALRAGNREARIVAVPIAMQVVEGAVLWLNTVFPRSSFFSGLQRFIFVGFQWPVPAVVTDVVGCLFNLCVLVLLLLRFTRTQQDEERLNSEIEAARMVQQVLVPAENPTIAGFDIQAVYKPAGQVGGDFYQIISTAQGGALIAIGDVSGKGMPAAMTVSLLVGTFRTLAHYTQSPGEILRAMNQRMLARSAGGFTTCLVLRVDADGTFTAANAGHLPPYADGLELQIENGLPLGLLAEAKYTESQFNLPPHGRLTLITDGIVEARNKNGELFGFERAAKLSSEPAEKVAEAARQFGQEDDITVLTLSRAGSAEKVPGRGATPNAASLALPVESN